MNFLKKQWNKLAHWQRVALLLVGYDVVAINAAFFLALWIRLPAMIKSKPLWLLR